jgi:hypothetical protein
MIHPCSDCPAGPCNGKVACPLAGTVINRHRCARIQSLPADKALVNVRSLWMREWSAAKAVGNRDRLKWLKWALNHENRIRRLWGKLRPDEQIRTLEHPVIGLSARAVKACAD